MLVLLTEIITLALVLKSLLCASLQGPVWKLPSPVSLGKPTQQPVAAFFQMRRQKLRGNMKPAPVIELPSSREESEPKPV